MRMKLRNWFTSQTFAVDCPHCDVFTIFTMPTNRRRRITWKTRNGEEYEAHTVKTSIISLIIHKVEQGKSFTFGFASQFDRTALGSHDVIRSAVGGLDLWRYDNSQVSHLHERRKRWSKKTNSQLYYKDFSSNASRSNRERSHITHCPLNNALGTWQKVVASLATLTIPALDVRMYCNKR